MVAVVQPAFSHVFAYSLNRDAEEESGERKQISLGRKRMTAEVQV